MVIVALLTMLGLSFGLMGFALLLLCVVWCKVWYLLGGNFFSTFLRELIADKYWVHFDEYRRNKTIIGNHRSSREVVIKKGTRTYQLMVLATEGVEFVNHNAPRDYIDCNRLAWSLINNGLTLLWKTPMVEKIVAEDPKLRMYRDQLTHRKASVIYHPATGKLLHRGVGRRVVVISNRKLHNIAYKFGRMALLAIWNKVVKVYIHFWVMSATFHSVVFILASSANHLYTGCGFPCIGFLGTCQCSRCMDMLYGSHYSIYKVEDLNINQLRFLECQEVAWSMGALQLAEYGGQEYILWAKDNRGVWVGFIDGEVNKSLAVCEGGPRFWTWRRTLYIFGTPVLNVFFSFMEWNLYKSLGLGD